VNVHAYSAVLGQAGPTRLLMCSQGCGGTHRFKHRPGRITKPETLNGKVLEGFGLTVASGVDEGV